MIHKSIVIVVIAVLSVSGYWLYTNGWLEMPRIFELPAVMGGSEASQEGHVVRPMPDTNSMPPREGGVRPDESSGLNWDALPGVLANLWIVAFIITIVVYSTRTLSVVSKQFAFQR
jgi:hypothetical protein